MNNRKTVAELLANLHRTSAEGVLKCNKMLDAFQDAVDIVAEHLSIDGIANGRPDHIIVLDEDVETRIKRFADSGYFIKIGSEMATSILTLLGDQRLNVTNQLGTPFTLTAVTDYTYSGCIIDVQSGVMDIRSIPNYKWNRVVMFHYQYADGRVEYYLSTKILASTNNLVPTDEANWMELVLDTDYGYEDNVLLLWYLLTRDRAIPVYTLNNAKAAFNAYYNLGFDTTQGAATQQTNLRLIQLAFPARSGVNELYNVDAWNSEMDSLLENTGLLYTDITSILKDISESGTLNTINEYVTRALGMLGGVSSIQGFLSGITNPSNAIQDYVSQLKTMADENTGFAAKFLGLWATSGISSNNRSIGFTDNDSLAPKLFLSGIIAAALAGVGALLTTILTAIVTYVFGAIGIVIGAALAGLGSIILSIGKKIDSTTYSGVEPESTISGFNFAYFQVGNSDNDFYTNIVDNIDNYGYAIISTSFCKILLWRNLDTRRIESEVHLTPLSYSDAQNLRAIINDCGVLHNQGTEYMHYYFEGTSQQVATCRERLAKYTADTPLGYTEPDMKERDVILKEGYLFAFCAFIVYLCCHQPYQARIKPYSGETAVAWSDASTASAFDAAFNMFGGNCISAINTEHLNGFAGSWPTWLDISNNNISTKTVPTQNAYWFCFRAIKLTAVPWAVSPVETVTLNGQFGQIYSLMGYEEYADTYYPAAYPTYVYTLPLVDRTSFIVGSIVVNLVVATVAATGAIISAKVRKAKARSAAKHAAKAENAWEDLKKNPDSKEAFNKYNSARFSNNFAANFNGGSKLSKYSYWSSAGLEEADDGSSVMIGNQEKIYSSITNRSL